MILSQTHKMNKSVFYLACRLFDRLSPAAKIIDIMHSLLRLFLSLLAVVNLVACEKLSGEAVVLEKEHIAAALPGDTPGPEKVENTPRPLADDEITVDSYVMKKDVRGTGRDPRAQQHEQWIVKVRTVGDGRTFNVSADKAQFDKLSQGDRIQVDYRLGKYTKTVWGAEIRN